MNGRLLNQRMAFALVAMGLFILLRLGTLYGQWILGLDKEPRYSWWLSTPDVPIFGILTAAGALIGLWKARSVLSASLVAGGVAALGYIVTLSIIYTMSGSVRWSDIAVGLIDMGDVFFHSTVACLISFSVGKRWILESGGQESPQPQKKLRT